MKTFCVQRDAMRSKNHSWPRKNLPRRRLKKPAKRRSNVRVTLRSSLDAGNPTGVFLKSPAPLPAQGFLCPVINRERNCRPFRCAEMRSNHAGAAKSRLVNHSLSRPNP
jgi:hypothetical protein